MSLSSPVTVEALKVLDVIDRRGSYAAAAEELDKVPSALSYVVQKLEEQLEVTLFQKQGRRSVLTPAGKHLLDEGREILVAIDRVVEQTQNVARGYESKIRIAIDTIADSSAIYVGIKSFLDAHPTIEIDIREEALNGVWEVLINDDVDLVIGAVDPVPQNKGIRTESIAMLNLVYVAHKDHPLALSGTPVNEQNLKEFRQIITHDSAREAVTWTRGIQSTSNHFYVPNMFHKYQVQKAGIGMGFLPRELVQNDLDSGILVELKLDISAHPPTPLYMAWKTVNQGKGLHALRSELMSYFEDKKK